MRCRGRLRQLRPGSGRVPRDQRTTARRPAQPRKSQSVRRFDPWTCLRHMLALPGCRMKPLRAAVRERSARPRRRRSDRGRMKIVFELRKVITTDKGTVVRPGMDALLKDMHARGHKLVAWSLIPRAEV